MAGSPKNVSLLSLGTQGKRGWGMHLRIATAHHSIVPLEYRPFGMVVMWLSAAADVAMLNAHPLCPQATAFRET